MKAVDLKVSGPCRVVSCVLLLFMLVLHLPASDRPASARSETFSRGPQEGGGSAGHQAAPPSGVWRGRVFIPDTPDGHVNPRRFLGQGPMPALVEPITSQEWHGLGSILWLSDDQVAAWMGAFPATVEAWNTSLQAIAPWLGPAQEAYSIARQERSFEAAADDASIRRFFQVGETLADRYGEGVAATIASLKNSLDEPQQGERLDRVIRLVKRRLQMTRLVSVPPGCWVDFEWELVADPRKEWRLGAVERAQVSDSLQPYSVALSSLLDSIAADRGAFRREVAEIDFELRSLGRSAVSDEARGLALREAKFAIYRQHRGPLIRIRDLGDVAVSVISSGRHAELSARILPWWEEASSGVAMDGVPPASATMERALERLKPDVRMPIEGRIREDDRRYLSEMKRLYRSWVDVMWVINFAEHATYREYARSMRAARLGWWTGRAEAIAEVMALLEEGRSPVDEDGISALLASLEAEHGRLVSACEEFRIELRDSDQVPSSEWPPMNR